MPSSSRVLPPSWNEVLEGMQRSLAEALAAIAPPPAPAEAPGSPPWQSTLERLDQRLAQLDASSRRVEQDATALEAELAGSADAVRRWLRASAKCRADSAEASGAQRTTG